MTKRFFVDQGAFDFQGGSVLTAHNQFEISIATQIYGKYRNQSIYRSKSILRRDFSLNKAHLVLKVESVLKARDPLCEAVATQCNGKYRSKIM